MPAWVQWPGRLTQVKKSRKKEPRKNKIKNRNILCDVTKELFHLLRRVCFIPASVDKLYTCMKSFVLFRALGRMPLSLKVLLEANLFTLNGPKKSFGHDWNLWQWEKPMSEPSYDILWFRFRLETAGFISGQGTAIGLMDFWVKHLFLTQVYIY